MLNLYTIQKQKVQILNGGIDKKIKEKFFILPTPHKKKFKKKIKKLKKKKK